MGQHIAAQEKHFKELLNDTALVESLVTDKSSEAKTKLNKDAMGIFSYAVNDIGNPVQLFWNTNTMAVNEKDLTQPDGRYAVTYNMSFFILLKKTVEKAGRQYMIFGLVPVHWQYAIEDDKLESRFTASPLFEKNYEIADAVNGTPVAAGNNKPLFYIQKKSGASFDQPETVSILLRVIAIIILMVFVNALATELAEKNGFIRGFLFLVTVVVSVRTITYFFPFPFDYSNLGLFDPGVYASSVLHPSLGDLLINSILLFWLVTFIKFNSHYLQTVLTTVNVTVKRAVGVFALFCLPIFTITVAIFLSSLVRDSADSELSFNVTDFFSLNGYTAVSLIIICFLILSFFYVAQLLISLSLLLPLSMYWRVIILLSFSLLFLSFKISDNTSIQFGFALVAWLFFFYFFVSVRRADITVSFYDSPYFMPWSIFLMASVTALLMFQNKQLELDKRISIAYKISRQTDPADERIVSMAITKFSDFFLKDNIYQFYWEGTNQSLKSNIINSNFRGYLKSFDTRIYTYDSIAAPLYNEDPTAYKDIKAILDNQGQPTNKPGLFYYENTADQFSYIFEKEIRSADNRIMGYVFLVIRPKVYKKEELTPELIKQLMPKNEISDRDYPYAIYNKNHLVKSAGNYNFKDTIFKKDLPRFELEFKENDGDSELWYNTTDNKLIIVARKDKWFAESVTFFAYLFGLFIILVLIQHFGHLIFKTRFNWTEIKKIFRFNIRTQIQTIIVSVTLISFVVIGFVTISFFYKSFNESNEEKLKNNARIMVNEIERLAKDRVVYSDMFNLSKLDINLDLEKRIVEIAETHNTDINFFDVSGNLLASSQQYIYDNNILSKKMNANAYNAMHYLHNTQVTQKDSMVNLSYLSIYVPVKNGDGSTLAYLNVPYINSENQLNQEISNFLVTLINLNALIFILAGAIAIWVTSRITSSFTLIANKMKAITFNTVNEEIEWKKDDELGELVTEYNKMVKKLSDSAKALARSEREGAWREMAQQVAHEIKNPLTPMKLSIQYLQKAIDNNMPNVKELSTKVAFTLVEQIDQLSNIASDFSQFANISNVKKEVFDLSDTLSSIINLYQADPRMQVMRKKEEGAYIIEADKMQMNRLFTNLIKNATEAYPENQTAMVIIRQIIKQKEVIISIQDRGEGIPASMQPKIFAPNFTTKTSGTGLGLAICKGIVEKANGHIWFETEPEKGTTFFVSLPLAQQ